MRVFKGIILTFAALSISCTGNKTAIIWTDRPEFALYADYFNTAQHHYKVSVRYIENPAEALKSSSSNPDIVVGSWIKNSSTDEYFKNINGLFGAKRLTRGFFYSRVLTIGRIGRKQYLLPVSFNLPALIFSKERELEISNPNTINFDEIKKLSKSFNAENRGVFTRMGFSPLWDDNFLFITATLSGVSFREAHPIAWDSTALEKTMNFIFNWTNEINTNNQAEEEFTFKYFFEPPEKLIQSGRILFSYMESKDLFSLSEENKSYLDYRWVIEQNKIPIKEDLVLMGIHKKAKSTRAAKAFIKWFFRPDNQRLLLEYCRANGINENVFGICGGLSSLHPVTEQIFPNFYPEILGRMPQVETLMPPNVLPGNWAVIKERIVVPYLKERARSDRSDDIYPLERRFSDWIRMNR